MKDSLRNAVESRVLSLWYPGSERQLPELLRVLVNLLLVPPSWLVSLYARRARSRTIRADRSHLPVVLVVGNLVAGGAGKTPATLAIATFLKKSGISAGLLCNAYRADSADAHLVDITSAASEVGDEALLLARTSGLPVASGRNRRDALKLLCNQHPDLQVIVSDDGLQHSAMARHLELAVFDGRGAGNRRLLPAGPLREPLEHVLQMDAILLNGTDASPIAHPRAFRFRIEARALISLRAFAQGQPQAGDPASVRRALDETVGQFRRVERNRILGIAGIAHPQRFADTLRSIGIDCPVRALGDHARLDAETLTAIDADVIVMTAKDAVKLIGVNDPRCWVLLVEAEFEKNFFPWLLGKIEPLIESSNHG